MFKSALFGAAIGGIAGLVKGDNYSSTAAMRNFAGGAAAGAGIGMGARMVLSRNGMRGVGNILRKTPALLRGAGSVAKFGGKAIGFGARHPAMALGGAAVVGGLLYTNNASQRSFDSMEGEPLDSRSSVRDFQNSAAGLTFGLHNRRHR